MYVNLSTGDCQWEQPENVIIKKMDKDQWWELYDNNTNRFYYYSAATRETIWHRPPNVDIVPLAKLQIMRQNTEVNAEASKRSTPLQASVVPNRSTSACRYPEYKHSLSPASSKRRSQSMRPADCSAKKCPTNSALQFNLRDSNHSPACYDHAEFRLPENSKQQQSLYNKQFKGTAENFNTASSLSSNNFEGTDKGEPVVLRAKVRHVKRWATSLRSSDLVANNIQSTNCRSHENVNRERSIKVSPDKASKTLCDQNYNDSPMASSCSVTRHSPYDSPKLIIKSQSKEVTLDSARTSQYIVTANSHQASNSMLIKSNNKPTTRRLMRESHNWVFENACEHFKRSSSVQGAPATWTPTSGNRSQSVTPNPSTNTPPVRTTLPIRHPPKGPVEQRLQGFEEQCTVSEASMDSGLPADNSSYDSLDGGPASHQTDGNKAPSTAPSQNESGNSSLGNTISERPTALAMGVSSLRGTPQSRRTAFPRTNPSYRRPTESKPNIIFSSQRCNRNAGNASYANLGTPETSCSIPVVSDDLEALSPDTQTSQSSGSSTEVAETRSSSQAALSSVGVVVTQPVNLNPCTAPLTNTKETMGLRASKTSSMASNSTTTTEIYMHPLGGAALLPNYSALPHSWLPNKCPDMNSPQIDNGGSGYYEAYVTSSMDMMATCPGSVPAPMYQSMSPPVQQPAPAFYSANPLPGWSSNLFRKNISPEKLLVWSKESLQKPMLKGTDKALKKESCDAFKYIQIFMGDRKSKHLPKEASKLLIKSAEKYPMLRDEILVQLCKQITNNPDELSTSRGWELMCVCLSHFLPSQILVPYLEGYVLRHFKNMPDEKAQPVLVQRFALIAAEILRQPLMQQGPVAAQQGMLSPALMRMEHVENSKLYPASMFGSTLEMVMVLQKSRHPDRNLPWILVSLCEEILKRKGREEERIFNLICDQNTLKALRISCAEFWDTSGQSYLEQFGKGAIKHSDLLHSPHCPANLLKCWIEELATPLIPVQLVSTCILFAHRPHEATHFVANLPPLNRLCLVYIIRFLQFFIPEDIVNRTKVRLDNLAQIFSISVFHNSLNYLQPEQIQPGSPDPMLELASFLRTLIVHLNTLEIKDIN